MSYLQSIGFSHALRKIKNGTNDRASRNRYSTLNIYTHPWCDFNYTFTRMLSLKSHASPQVSRICNRNITVHKQYFPDVCWFEGLLKCASLYLSKFTSRQKFTLRDWCLLNSTYDERRHIMELNGIAVLWLKIEVTWFGFPINNTRAKTSTKKGQVCDWNTFINNRWQFVIFGWHLGRKA